MATGTLSTERGASIWQAYHARKPVRVPVRWNVNPRIVIMDPALNTEGWTFEGFMTDPETLVRVTIRFHEYIAETLSRVSDTSGELPQTWPVHVATFNTYEGGYFGAPYGEVPRFRPGQVPTSEHFLAEDDVDGFLAQDYGDPLENAWVCGRMAFRERVAEFCRSFEYRGRKATVGSFAIGGSDGPVTTAADIFGSDFFALLGAEPERGVAVLEKILIEQIRRTETLVRAAGGVPMEHSVWFADDSVQLLGSPMFDEIILPLHRKWYAAFDPEWKKPHAIHLCGDAMRHFPSLRRVCNVTSFDTGFPVDFAWMRRTLGPDTEISGGVPVATIMNGTADECHAAARDILESGIMQGGRFILQEANNLPPCAPVANLKAIFDAAREFGQY